MHDFGFLLSMAIYGLYRGRADLGTAGEITDDQVGECYQVYSNAVEAALAPVSGHRERHR